MDRIVLFGRVNPQAGALPLPGAGRHRLRARCPTTRASPHPLAALRGDGAARCAASGARSTTSTPSGCSARTCSRSGSRCWPRCAGKKVFLGVRQDLPRYVESRHPGKRWMTWAANVLEGTFRLMARRFPVVVVGPQLAANYRGARPPAGGVGVAGRRGPDRRSRRGGRQAVGERRAAGPDRRPAGDREEPAAARRRAGAPARARPALPPADLRRGPDGRRRRGSGCASWASPTTRTCSATCRSTAACSTCTARATPSCTCRGPRGCRRRCSRRSRPACRWWRPPWAACRPRSATPRCWSSRATPDPPAAELLRIAGDEDLRRRLIESGIERVRGNTLEAESRRVAEFFAANR